jgi:acetyltransferase-like isoleucine patch superfamily enzyme
VIIITYKLFRKIYITILHCINQLVVRLFFIGNGVKYRKFKTSGIPYVMVAQGGIFSIGENFSMHNGIRGNPIGCYSKCTFFVDRNAILTVGNNVGLSQTALICHQSITIGDNVKIGGGVKIFDTDFHSLDALIRSSKEDKKDRAKAPILIKNNVFIGAFSIILKGVTIGENCIIGAGSVVTKSVPDNQIWAGNPAKFIREL